MGRTGALRESRRRNRRLLIWIRNIGRDARDAFVRNLASDFRMYRQERVNIPTVQLRCSVMDGLSEPIVVYVEYNQNSNKYIGGIKVNVSIIFMKTFKV